jgi:hypothetical protein
VEDAPDPQVELDLQARRLVGALEAEPARRADDRLCPRLVRNEAS